MVGKNNYKINIERSANQYKRYTLKKLSFGVVSVSIGTGLLFGNIQKVSAEEMPYEVEQPEATDSTASGGTVTEETATQPMEEATASEYHENISAESSAIDQHHSVYSTESRAAHSDQERITDGEVKEETSQTEGQVTEVNQTTTDQVTPPVRGAEDIATQPANTASISEADEQQILTTRTSPELTPPRKQLTDTSTSVSELTQAIADMDQNNQRVRRDLEAVGATRRRRKRDTDNVAATTQAPYVTLERYFGEKRYNLDTTIQFTDHNYDPVDVSYKVGTTNIRPDELDLTEDAKKLGFTYDREKNFIHGTVNHGHVGQYTIGLINKATQHQYVTAQLTVKRYTFQSEGMYVANQEDSYVSIREGGNSNLSSYINPERDVDTNAAYVRSHQTNPSDRTGTYTVEMPGTPFGYRAGYDGRRTGKKHYSTDGWTLSNTPKENLSRYSSYLYLRPGLNSLTNEQTAPVEVASFQQAQDTSGIVLEWDKTFKEDKSGYSGNFYFGRIKIKSVPDTAGSYTTSFTITDNYGVTTTHTLNVDTYEQSQDGYITQSDVELEAAQQVSESDSTPFINSGQARQTIGKLITNKSNATIRAITLPDGVQYDEASQTVYKVAGKNLAAGTYTMTFTTYDPHFGNSSPNREFTFTVYPELDNISHQVWQEGEAIPPLTIGIKGGTVNRITNITSGDNQTKLTGNGTTIEGVAGYRTTEKKTVTFEIHYTDSDKKETKMIGQFTYEIQPSQMSLTVTPEKQTVQFGQAITPIDVTSDAASTVKVNNGNPLPTGLVYHEQTKQITGTPEVLGEHEITFEITRGGATLKKSVTIKVEAEQSPTMPAPTKDVELQVGTDIQPGTTFGNFAKHTYITRIEPSDNFSADDAKWLLQFIKDGQPINGKNSQRSLVTDQNGNKISYYSTSVGSGPVTLQGYVKGVKPGTYTVNVKLIQDLTPDKGSTEQHHIIQTTGTINLIVKERPASLVVKDADLTNEITELTVKKGEALPEFHVAVAKGANLKVKSINEQRQEEYWAEFSTDKTYFGGLLGGTEFSFHNVDGNEIVSANIKYNEALSTASQDVYTVRMITTPNAKTIDFELGAEHTPDNGGDEVKTTVRINVLDNPSLSREKTYSLPINTPVNIKLPAPPKGMKMEEISEYQQNDLPKGLTYDPDTQTISGMPTQLGQYKTYLRFYHAAYDHNEDNISSWIIGLTFDITPLQPTIDVTHSNQVITYGSEMKPVTITPSEQAKMTYRIDGTVVAEDETQSLVQAKYGINYDITTRTFSGTPTRPDRTLVIEAIATLPEEVGGLEATKRIILSTTPQDKGLELIANRYNQLAKPGQAIRPIQLKTSPGARITFETTDSTTGLPDGLTYNEQFRTITGQLSTPGRYDIKATATTLDGSETVETWLAIDVLDLQEFQGASVLSGPTVPETTIGKAGDTYIHSTTGDVYLKSTTGWNKNGNIKGKSGNSVYSGPVAPALTVGVQDGDTYVNTTTGDVWKYVNSQ